MRLILTGDSDGIGFKSTIEMRLLLSLEFSIIKALEPLRERPLVLSAL